MLQLFLERHYFLDKLNKLIPIISPTHPLKLVFDLIIALIIITYFCYIPFSLAFGLN